MLALQYFANINSPYDDVPADSGKWTVHKKFGLPLTISVSDFKDGEGWQKVNVDAFNGNREPGLKIANLFFRYKGREKNAINGIDLKISQERSPLSWAETAPARQHLSSTLMGY
jgi:hypothetical protein